MATLALSVVGAGLGSATGVGAAAGWQLGSALGQIFFPGDSSKGSRLTDLKLSGASYGATIPQLFGSMRLAGNVIWAAPLEYRTTTTETGGKGGVSASSGQAAYEYFASFALCLAKGEVGALLKIWADGEVIYDVTSAGESRIAGLNFRFYSGDEDQLPDSIMASELGADTVPGYRGLSYLVFDSLPLGNYGNRIPNIEVLISQSGVAHYPQQTGSDGYYDASSVAYDCYRGHFYSYEVTGGVDKIRKIDLANLSVETEANIGSDFPTLADSSSGFSLDRQGDFWIGSGFGMLPGRKISRFNTKAMITEFEADLPVGIGAVTWSVDILSSLNGVSFQVAGSQQNAQVVVFDTALNVVDYIATESISCTGGLRDENETAWIAMSGLAAIAAYADLQIVQLAMTANQSEAGVEYGTQSVIHTIDQSDLTPLGGVLPESNNITRLVGYVRARRELIFQNNYRIFAWSMDSQIIRVRRDEAGLGKLSLVNTNDGETIVYLEGGRWLIYVSTEDLQEAARVDLFDFSGVSSASQYIYDASSDSICIIDAAQPLQRLYLRRTIGNEVDYQDMLEPLSLAAGLPLSDIDVSSVSGSVPGYILNRPMSVQEALKPLMIAGDLEISESGYQLKFIPRKDSADIEISVDNLLRPPAQRRLQESELPGSITFNYMAADMGHGAGSQSAKRSYAPTATMFGRNEVTRDLPLSLTAAAAKKICQRSLFTSWSERNSLTAGLPLKYMMLDAADVVCLRSDAGDITARLTGAYLGADLTSEMEAVQTSPVPIVTDLPADAGSGYNQVLIERPAGTELFILDLPLLRDEDATAGLGSRYYYGMDGVADNWRGAGMFISDTGERYELRGAVQSEIGWGVAATALGGTDDCWQTDHSNSVTVRFLSGEERLQNISDANLLNNANALLVGDEIINFRNVTVLPDGSYQLSTLLRGRRGTEGAINTHKVGEKAFLLEADSMARAVMSLGFLNLPHHFKAVAAGQLLEEAPEQIKALTGRDLQPFAPVHINWTRSEGEIFLSWQRRSRISGMGLSSDPPLAEAFHRYELCFEYDGSLVSKYVLNDMNYTYQLTEFNKDYEVSLLEIPTLDLTLYQLSDTIGRGLATKEII